MTSRSAFLPLALVACAATLVSCTNVLGIEETKYEQPLAAPGEDWSCVGTSRPASTTTSVKLTLDTIPFFSATADPLPGMEVRACSLIEPGCDTKAPLGTTELTPDPDDPEKKKQVARLSVTLPVVSGGFNGYLQFSDPNGVYKTLRWLFSQPRTQDVKLVVAMAGKDDLTMFAGSLDAPNGGKLAYDATKGVLTYSLVTCGTDSNGGAVPGINAEVLIDPRNAEAAGYYFDGQTFTSDTKQKKTAAAGRGAFFNVAPGSVTLTVKYDGRAVATQKSIPVSADTITTIDMFPDRSAN